METSRINRRRLFGGATLIELCVALAIVALLATLTLAAIQASRLSARRMSCLARLRGLNLALQNYHADHGCFPFDFTNTAWPRCLPYLGETSLYGEIDWENPSSTANSKLTRRDVPIFAVLK